jgi:hypothetical protein
MAIPSFAFASKTVLGLVVALCVARVGVPQDDPQDHDHDHDHAHEEADSPPGAPPRNRLVVPMEELTPLPVPDELPDEIKAVVADLAKEGVTVDFAAKRVEVRGIVLLDKMNAGYPIEYLLVTSGGFTHEALGLVRCTPSKLNTAFLAFGMVPGKSVQYKQRDPLPPLEKIQSGEEREFDVFAPEGEVMDVFVKWTDTEGHERMHPIEDLLVYLTNGQSIPRRGFVYVGSRFQKVLVGTKREERFMADVEGNILSLYLAGSGNCLFDPNSVEGAEGSIYDVNSALCPPRGTPVTYVFQRR